MRAARVTGLTDSVRRLIAAVWYRRGWRFRVAATILIIALVGAFGLSGWLNAPRVHAMTAGVTGTPGNLYGWGLNGDGELAATTSQTCSGYACSAAPIQAAALANVVAVAGGGMHSLAALSDGSVWAWGANNSGQVGPGIPVSANSSTSTPVQVTGLPSNAIAVATGEYFSLALTASGVVYAWGDDSYGELGPSVTPSSSSYSQSPVQVTGLPAGIVAIAARGGNGLALASDGSVWAWGADGSGQLGSSVATMCGSYPCSAMPLQVAGLSGITSIASGGAYNLALTQGGTVYAWGDNSNGNLGDGSTTSSASPVQVSGLTNITVIAAGTHDLALTGSGQVYAWGQNQSGELGASATQICGMYYCSTTPLLVGGLPSNVSALSVGGGYSLALANGSVYSWGANNLGELGIGASDIDNHPIPTLISGLSGVTAIATGDNHAFAIATPPSGTTSQAVASLSASSFDFGDQQITTSSAQRTFTLTNTGNAAMSITGAALTGANSGDFVLASTTCVGAPSNPVTIQPGGTCDIGVIFAPTATGIRSATLSVTCDAVNCPLNGDVTGNGINPVANYSPTALDFGDAQIGAGCVLRTVTASNSGTTPLTVNSYALTNTTDFHFNAQSQPLTIAPGASGSLSVYFCPQPGDTGTRTATLSVISNDTLSPNTISLSGVGINPSGAISPTSLSFTGQYVGTASAAQTVAVSNSGTTDLIISAVNFGGANPGDFAYSAPALPITVTPGASASFGVTFAPTAAGSRSATLTFATNDNRHTLSVALSGSGLAPADNAISLSASPSPVRSGSQLTYTIVVINTGPGAASGIQVTDTLPGGTTFAKVTTTAGSCSAPSVGGTGTLTCSISGLASGASVTITLVVGVKAPNGSALSDTASVSATSYDPNSANNSASVTTSVSKR